MFEYDVLGRLAEVVEADNATTTYAYDEVGNRTSVTDARGNETQFAYDPLSRPTSTQKPSGVTNSIQYDAVGNRITTTDFIGKENELPGINSFVEGSFHDASAGMVNGDPVEDEGERVSLQLSDSNTFEAEWREHRQKPL